MPLKHEGLLVTDVEDLEGRRMQRVNHFVSLLKGDVVKILNETYVSIEVQTLGAA